MSVTIKFQRANKRRNSTAEVDFTTSTWGPYTGEMVEPFDASHPTVKMWFGVSEAGKSHVPTILNYAYIDELYRYYWIDSWTYDAGFWICTLTVDALATYREAIGACSVYILRSASVQNSAISDSFYPTACNPDYSAVDMTTDFDPVPATGFGDTDHGCYIVGIVNSDSSSVGCTSYYMFDNAGFRAFANKLLDNIDWASAGIDEISAPLLKSLFNPMQYITSCIWLPFRPTAAATSNISLPFGWWSFQAKAVRLKNFTTSIVYSGTVSQHPQKQSMGTYLNYPPYTRAMLSWGPIGDLPIDCSYFGPNDNRLQLKIRVDLITGAAYYTLNKTGTPIKQLCSGNMQIGVNVSVAQSSQDYIGAVKNAAGAVSSGMRGDVGGIVGGATDALASLIPQISTGGSNGNCSVFETPPKIVAQYYSPTTISPDVNGYATYSRRQIDTLSGYILTDSNARYTGPGLTSEVQQIEDAFHTGFFYE